jgi:FixJ family two-component response regulator
MHFARRARSIPPKHYRFVFRESAAGIPGRPCKLQSIAGLLGRLLTGLSGMKVAYIFDFHQYFSLSQGNDGVSAAGQAWTRSPFEGDCRMQERPILIVDDEKNIRLTVSHSLESLGVQVETAVNAEEALNRIKAENYGVLLMDLRLPGMDGMEALRRIRALRPDIQIIIVTAFGSIELAVQAMKLGAVDFIQKPFAPQEIREAVLGAIEKGRHSGQGDQEYRAIIELAARCIDEGLLDVAEQHLRNAIGANLFRPEAFNLMGTLLEMRRDKDKAQKCYRAALSIDPDFDPARQNLKRAGDVLTRRDKE